MTFHLLQSFLHFINTHKQNLIPLQHLEVFLTKLLLHLRFGSLAVVPDSLMLAKTFDGGEAAITVIYLTFIGFFFFM